MTRRSDIDYKKAMRKRAKAEETSVSGAGRTLLEILKEELDRSAQAYFEKRDLVHKIGSENLEQTGMISEELMEEIQSMRQRRGIMIGLAQAIAIIENPYAWKKSVRRIAKEAVLRGKNGSQVV